MRRIALSVLIVLLVGLAACGGGSDDVGSPEPEATTTTAATTTTEAGPPYEVEIVEETWVDTARDPERTIVTRISHPTGGGPYPLLVLSHGFTGHPEEYAENAPMWAADGFVVAQPTFPFTNRDAPGEPDIGDVVNQPGDVSFVIDQVLAATDDPDSPLHGLVDTESIGVAGHSLGAATTWAVAFNSATRDDRIDSATIFAGLTMDMPGGQLELDSGLPLLVLHGDADDVPLSLDHDAWDQAASPKWFVTLHGAEHRLAFTDEESPYDELVTRTVLDFWHGTLDGDAAALDRVTESATDPELSTVEEG